MSDSFDVAIVGGGMVGASLAAALTPLGLRVALVESVPLQSESQPSFDERTTALSNGSRRILNSMGVWDAVAPEAAPIRRIHVSDQGRFGFARIDAAEEGVAALGFVLANRVLGAALWERLAGDPAITIFCPARVDEITASPETVTLQVEADEQPPRTLRARLLVAADGANSGIRKALGIEATRWDYEQTAIITNVATRKFHDHVAYERFTNTGPLAVLPLADGRCTVVWTLAPEVAQATLQLDDATFLARLQERFGFRLGRFTRVGRRHAYPLALTRAEERVGKRVVIIGNAAQGLHPIAGQGFNLGLRDVATLAEVIADSPATLGDEAMLARYDEWRRTDRRGVIAFTDGLVRLFGNPLGSVKVARDLGLLLFDVLPPAKSALSALSMGITGKLPRLARGVPLT
ncbi:MAG TPA: 2-octaprenyl-6-methoxyphenyl hydroxylase [Steroidobacteraceae bacterium]|nr:2-octaprenyl-6-methoxyphenyl hydroxylase [Steroidobacteraceae bacterium]